MQTLEYQATHISPHFPVLMHRMVFVQLVAHFEAFLLDVFEAVILANPDILKSQQKQLDYETILSHSSMNELVRYLAKRELHGIGYKSIREQAEYYEKRFGVNLGSSEIGVERLVEIEAIRNLLLHNDGTVNEIFLKEVRNSRYLNGEIIQIATQEWLQAYTALEMLARHVTEELSKKHDKANYQPSQL